MQCVVNATGTRDLTLLMATLDDVNRRFGRGALHLASAGLVDATRAPDATLYDELERDACALELVLRPGGISKARITQKR